MFLLDEMEPKRIKLEDLRVKEFKLPLRNKKGEIVAYTLVDEDDFERFKHLRFHYSAGYANNDLGALHRLITSAKKGEIVDHINGNRLDNRKENLRIVSHSENARNRIKNVNTSSIYYGVAWDKRDSRWICAVRVDNKDIFFNFDKEDHAAYYRDVLVKRYNLTGSKLNGLDKPIDFIEPIKKHKTSRYGIGVGKVGNKFRAEITWNFARIFIGSFDTLEKAQTAYKNKKEELEKEKEEKRLATPIKRNADGKAVIELFNRKKEKVGEATVSDYRYYDAIVYGWCYSRGRVSGRVNGKTIKLHRFLMNAKPGDLVDHIDRNPLNNEMENLRFSNHKLNAHNRSKSKNATSQYFGVHFRKLENAFAASIKKDRKTQYIGYFKDELEAAKAFDNKAIELYGDKARLNFP